MAMVLLGPVCLFWHKILSDWHLSLDIPPVATRHAWLVMKNSSPSSWLHTRHTKICSHTEQDLWHRSYIRLSGFWKLWQQCSSSELWMYDCCSMAAQRPIVLSVTNVCMCAFNHHIFDSHAAFWLCMWNYLTQTAEYFPCLMKSKPSRLNKGNKTTCKTGCSFFLQRMQPWW